MQISHLAHLADDTALKRELKETQQQATLPSSALISPAVVKTSPPPLSPSRLAARDGKSEPLRPETPESPALSTTSTADCDLEYSPVLPPLPAPVLPGRAAEFLRTPPNEPEDDRYITASWGSPYPDSHRDHLRVESFSSGTSEESPIHQLDIHTPFLRPPPELERELADQSNYAFVSASVLATRARRRTGGLTEDWIRQHTASDLAEGRLWLSDGTEEDEPSSLSGSEVGWLEPHDIVTPRADSIRFHLPGESHRYARTRSSVETLTPESLARMTGSPVADSRMTSMDYLQPSASAVPDASTSSIETPAVPAPLEAKIQNVPSSASPSGMKVNSHVHVPRTKKKVPWKGKNILVLVPLDHERGQPGKAPFPLSQIETEKMWSSWNELGYDTRGFDLNHDDSQNECQSSQSRAFWPSHAEMEREHRDRRITVALPDLNAWKNYVDELNEAKLRALGVSSHDDEPSALPSISPAPSNASRITSSQHPGQPFSPPIPSSSASSNPFPFAAAPFVPGGRSSSVTSPGIQSTTSPFGLPGKYNSRQSISIPASASPFQFPPQPSPQNWAQQAMFMQGASRGESPLSLNGLASPSSPFQQTGSPGFNMHQRHQSLQYPMLPHQQMPHFSPRGTPALHELQEEVEEEAPSKSPSKTPEASKRNPDGLQAEIDDAEYHLEEQLRNELEHEDYSPHNEEITGHGAFQMADSDYFPTSHGRHQSVQFALPEQVASNSGPGPVLHHPRPHSRGQSLGHGFFMNRDEAQANGDGNGGLGRFKLPAESSAPRTDDAEEIQTNPSNLGTPVQDFNLASILPPSTHQRALSTTSNPWEDVAAASQNSANRRMSHGSKASVSKLNVEAPEFKFNPQSTFQPGQFVFGGNAFEPQPTILQTNPLAQPLPPSATSSQFSMSTGSKINASAPVFSPGRSDFSFSSSGPKFRPDAPAFTPLGGASAVAITSPLGSEDDKRAGYPMFDRIDIPAPDILRPSKTSKAVPIIRPSSRDSSPARSTNEDLDGRLTDDTRVKRARASPAADDDAVPLFAEPSDTARDLSATQAAAAALRAVSDQRSGDEGAEMADTSMSSMMMSEVTDAKPTAPTSTSSQSETSPQWGAFEFDSQADMRSFHNALPVGENEPFRKGHHKKSLSAAAKPFTPGSFLLGDVEAEPQGDEKLDDDKEKGESAVETVSLNARDSESAALEQAMLSVDANEFVPKAFSPSAKVFEPTSFHPTAPEFKPKNEQDIENEAQQSAEESVDEPAGEPESTTPIQAPPVLHRVPQGLAMSRFVSPPPKPKGLAASRFAATPSPEPAIEESSPVSSKDAEWERESVVQQLSPTPDPYDDEAAEDAHESDADHVATDGDEFHPVAKATEALGTTEPTFEEIDAVMRHINENDPLRGVNYRADSPQFHQPSPTRQLPFSHVTSESPFRLPPTQHFRSDAPSPSPRRYLPGEPAQPIMTTELDDPFVEAHMSDNSYSGAIQRLNATEMLPVSDWDEDFSDTEQDKLEHRVQFFDGHVNDVVSTVLTSRLDPVERTLDSIQRALSKLSGRGVSAHRRSTSRENDADDEDDEEPGAHRSMSPQRSRRVEQIRTAVLDALASHERSVLPPVVADPLTPQDNMPVLQALEELKEQFGTSLRLDSRSEDLRNIVEEAIERRMPQAPQLDEDTSDKLGEMHAKVADLEQRLQSEQARAEKEMADRRATQDAMAELQRKLDAAETQVEIQIMNRSIFDGRVSDLEETLANEKQTLEEQVSGRRAAEDRLSEVQRLLRISTEEETRLREALDERDQRIRSLEQATTKTTMRLTLLDAAQANATRSQSELTNRISAADADLRGAKEEVNRWRLEAERAIEGARRMESDLSEALNEKKHLHKLLDTLGTQLEENERVRDSWRTKFLAFQDDMARASAQITEENARRTKKEQALIARQEVLDARLQAEARTRERLETEIERLEGGERQGMRAVSESKRLEALLSDLRNENHKIHQAAMRYQREFEDAREAGAGEVQRVRIAMQAQLDDANNQVNVVRADLEEQMTKLRNDLDHAKIDIGSVKAQSEMLLEEAQATKDAEFQQLDAKYSNEMEDMQTRHDRQLSTAVDEAQTREQRLLERLSISASRTEHLQDRVIHLEEKLEIAKEAAHAAARAAKASSSSEFVLSPSAMQPTRSVQAMDLPEKVSPQALRESIMVLQEQLQEREQRIEELQHTVDDMDPDAPTKIAKRDDEITWLRELLAVRHGDLQDIIGALSAESYDKDRVRDAVIRLQANLQMEEQERERAMNGASAVRLPNIAQTIREAATPRVAQAVGPIAAAWGSWRKAQPSFGSFSGVLSSPASASTRNHTPSKASTLSQNNGAVSGLMTPPTSSLRQTPTTTYPPAQPTAFTASGRRFTGQRSEHGGGRSSISSRRAEKLPAVTTPPRHTEHAQPVTPPMMERSGYDSDANPGDFDDHGFFVDD